MFWRASKLSVTPNRRAVAGMSCISPRAPAVETAKWSKADSTWIMARTRSRLTPCRATAASMWASNSVFDEARMRKPAECTSVPFCGMSLKSWGLAGTFVASSTPLLLIRL